MRSLFRSHRRLAPRIAGLAALAVVLGPFRSIADAQEPSIRLWQSRAPEARGDSVVDQPSLTPFLAPTAKATGTAIVIFPGGGYQHLAIDKEGNDVARWLNRLGVRIRRHVSTRTALPTSRDASRRTARRSLYPVITMDDRWAHHGSRVNPLGASPSDSLVRLMSNETQVTAHTPPAFIVATTDDATVPVQNSVMFYDALLAATVPAELHIFESGRHGFGLAPADPVLSTWLSLCEAWMRRVRGMDAPARLGAVASIRQPYPLITFGLRRWFLQNRMRGDAPSPTASYHTPSRAATPRRARRDRRRSRRGV